MCVAGSGGATYSLHNPCQVARVRLRCRAHVRGGQREYAATATFAPTHLDTASRYGEQIRRGCTWRHFFTRFVAGGGVRRETSRAGTAGESSGSGA